jgi:hypothetical protein
MNLVTIVPVVGRIYFTLKLWVHVKLFVFLDTINLQIQLVQYVTPPALLVQVAQILVV